ncbi:Inositolphosphorylceramide synthase subunit Kei1 domain-containing protein [Neurospora intermedia]|uniref:Inositolphosphorylceramide synthase subunit Kei1 domain-containing protein n=1 Tax=Neurospora intermedia TaxID=5142 RepID=A0ABR3DFF7_NEUIN
MSRGLRLRFPRPRTFLGFMSLQTGTELIALSLVFNRITGIYGILALFTGFPLSLLQISLYLLSVLVVGSLAYLIPHIRHQSPFQNLALAFLYGIDTLLNFAYVTFFATTWYLTQFHDPQGPASKGDIPESASPSNGEGNYEHDSAQKNQLEKAVGVHESAASMCLVVGFTLIRIYFALVVCAYARAVVQRYVDMNSGWAGGPLGSGEAVDDNGKEEGHIADPFVEGAPLGEGWQGKMGRMMVGFGRGYWLGGRKEDEEWAREIGGRLKGGRYSRV